MRSSIISYFFVSGLAGAPTSQKRFGTKSNPNISSLTSSSSAPPPASTSLMASITPVKNSIKNFTDKKQPFRKELNSREICGYAATTGQTPLSSSELFKQIKTKEMTQTDEEVSESSTSSQLLGTNKSMDELIASVSFLLLCCHFVLTMLDCGFLHIRRWHCINTGYCQQV
jgi:hypothetical protein